MLAVVIGIFAAPATSTEVGGVVGFLGAGVALAVAARPLPKLDYFRALDALPAAAILLFLLGGIVPGISVDDLPTIGAVGLTVWWQALNVSI